jgi:hypothetical protein
MPCELVVLMVCGSALYQSAKVVALKIQTDRLALARAAHGLDDLNTVKGAARVCASCSCRRPTQARRSSSSMCFAASRLRPNGSRSS